MQINPVHNLLNLLRAESPKGRTTQEQQQLQLRALADLLEQSAMTSTRITQIERRLGTMPRAGQIGPALQHEGHEATHGTTRTAVEVPIAGPTSDAMTRTQPQHHGRVGAYSGPGDVFAPDHLGVHDMGTADDLLRQQVNGVAMPYVPSREDMRHALHTGEGWPKDWGNGIRQSLLHNPPPSAEESWPTLAVRLLSFVVFLMFLAWIFH